MNEGKGKQVKRTRYSRPEEFEVAIFRDVMVAMRDGVRLAVDLYFPAKNGAVIPGKFAAILDRTPYDKVPRALVGNFPEYFAKRGYVFVFADERGHGGSEGEFYSHWQCGHAGPDGYDLAEWIVKQPFSNGVVLGSGYSYDGATQNSTAREGSPHLKAMFPAFVHSTYYHDMGGTHGAFRMAHNLVYCLGHAKRDRRARQNPRVEAWLLECEKNVWDWFKKPLSRQIEIFRDVPMTQRCFQDMVEHSDFDDYWKDTGYNVEGFYHKFPDIPIHYFGGWFDALIRGTIKNYVELSKIHKSPTILTIGPWCHGPVSAKLTWQGDVDFGPDSALDWNEDRLQLYDQVAKGKDTGLFEEPRVRLFVMGGGDGRRNMAGRMNHGGRWRLETAWPLPQTKFTKYYFHSDGSLGPDLPGRDSSPRRYSFDPAHPLPQIGGGYTCPWLGRGVPGGSGPHDQVCREEILACKHCGETRLPLSARPDILVYMTAPLEKDIEVVGPLTVHLWASSSAVDTDFTVKLVDVYPPNEDYPNGYAMYLIDSILRARYRESFERQVLMKPGEIYPFTIDLWATANLFKAGHRIRLDVSSSNFPTFDVNPNTGEKIGYHTRTVIAENTIYQDAAHPSHIVLPILP